jgi:hypothetical protein
MVIGDIERILVAWPGQADVGQAGSEGARGGVVAFARELNSDGRVRGSETG